MDNPFIDSSTSENIYGVIRFPVLSIIAHLFTQIGLPSLSYSLIRKTEAIPSEILGQVKTAVATTVVETTEEANQETKVEIPVQDPKEFLENFNWEKYEQGIEKVDDSKLEEFEKLVSENFVDTADEEVVSGTVVYLTDREAIIDINAKSEGVISLNEFRYNPDLKVGDKVEVTRSWLA